MYRFGPFTLDPRLGELRKQGRPVRLQPQPASLLVLLVSRAGEIVTREEIQRALWSADTFVDYDQAINFCVKRIRQALGDDPAAPRYLETVPRRGYRFVANIEKETTTKSAVPSVFLRWVALGAAVLSAALLAVALAHRGVKSDELLPVTVPFTSLEGEEEDPSFSPDGQQIAFTWNQGPGGFTHLFVKMVAGGQPLQLTRGEVYDSSPSWSPDGSSLAFLRSELPRAGNPDRLYDVLVVPALGGSERLVARTAAVQPVWSPDGERLVLGGETAPTRGLDLLSLHTGERKPLTSIPEGEARYDGDPAFSPDGRTLAFVRHAYETGGLLDEIYLRSVEGGDARRVSSRFRDISGLEWTSDGKALVFSAPFLHFRRQLWKLPVDGGAPTRLRTESDPGFGLSVARSGNRLAYTSFTWTENVWRAPGPTAKERRPPVKFIGSTRHEQMAEYSPDGTKIVFVSDRDGDPSLWIADGDGQNAFELAGTSNAHLPRWSPKGDEIAYGAGLEPDGAGVFVVSASGGVPRHLTPDEERASFPSWSPDGHFIVYQTWVDGDWEIRRRSAQGGASERVTRVGGTTFPEVLGDRLLYTKDSKLWSMPDGGGEAKLLTNERVVLWTVWRGKVVYPHRHADREVTIELFDPETGETSVVTSLGTPPFLQLGFDVSPDGEWILYSQRDDRKKDILLVENFDPPR